MRRSTKTKVQVLWAYRTKLQFVHARGKDIQDCGELHTLVTLVAWCRMTAGHFLKSYSELVLE